MSLWSMIVAIGNVKPARASGGLPEGLVTPAPALRHGFALSGHRNDNTVALSATTWRHVAFVEQVTDDAGSRATTMQPFQSNWLMMSDVCKHCESAACLEACPTGALFKTEYQTVVVQPDICNGCGYCVPACPFGVVDLDVIGTGRAQKCTLCYDRLKGGFEPACAKACPTNSIQFGDLRDLQERATRRVEDLHRQGVSAAYLYGASAPADRVPSSRDIPEARSPRATTAPAARGELRRRPARPEESATCTPSSS
jgi:Fe-S-cluster-containing dehydrogenase component